MPGDNQTTEATAEMIRDLRNDWAWQKPCRDAAVDLLRRAQAQADDQERLCRAIEARAAAMGVKL